MNTIPELCHQLKYHFTPKNTNVSRPVHTWSEPDRLHDDITNAYVIIFKTKGCRWAHTSGCTMCGYFNDTAWKKVTRKDIKQQLNAALKGYNQEKIVKIFTSGSFFDPTELSPTMQQEILTSFAHTAEKISVESRPEFLTATTLSKYKDHCAPGLCEIGIGLETATDYIRTHCINKGFSFSSYKKAAQTMQKKNIDVKTYVLLKPPFLTEQQAINDAITTIEKSDPYTTLISLNPTTVQKNTVVEYLWRRDHYRPPWLWSVMEVLKKASTTTTHRIQCDIVGGGSRRGAHNCSSCDKESIKKIQTFSLHQDPTIFTTISCSCKKHWQDQLVIEPLSFGSIIDTT